MTAAPDVLPSLQAALAEIPQTPNLSRLLVEINTAVRTQIGNVSALAADNIQAHDDLRASIVQLSQSIEAPFQQMGASLGATHETAGVVTRQLVERVLAIESAGNTLDSRV